MIKHHTPQGQTKKTSALVSFKTSSEFASIGLHTQRHNTAAAAKAKQ